MRKEPSESYFQQSRADVAALIPAEARRILDVGCGFGGLGKVLVTRTGCEVHGIERNPQAATELKGIYSRYEIGDAERGFELFAGERYDCIVFADILEHLVDPWSALAGYTSLLAPGACVVCSIPNVRNLALIFDLVVRGRWRYVDSGLLDRTHLRFFTRQEIEQMFAGAGLSIEAWAANRDRFSGLRRMIAALPYAIVPDLAICQFLVRARRTPEKEEVA